jgi:hypothetical protein
MRCLALFFVLFATCTGISAQPEYKGLRLALFDFEVQKKGRSSVTIQCDVANTGRLPWDSRLRTHPDSLVLELDSLNLPTMLQGRTALLKEALLRQKMALAPGDVRPDLTLKIQLDRANINLQPQTDSPVTQCADLVFDTAFVVEYTERSMSLEFVLRNQGALPAKLLGSTTRREDNLAVNVYFNSGMQLTRGAIFAGGMFVQEGRETIGGLLLPGQQLRGNLEISLKGRTRFAPNLIFELDPFQALDECDRTNNTKALLFQF